MSILKDRNNLFNENIFNKKKILLSNSEINNFIPTIPMIKVKKKIKKSLNDFSTLSHQATSDNYLPTSTPEKLYFRNKIFNLNKFKPSTLKNPKKLEKISLINMNQNTEKKPENNLRNSFHTTINNKGLNISSNNVNYMIFNIGGIIKNEANDDLLKLPLNSNYYEFTNQKMNFHKSNQSFYPRNNSKGGPKKIQVIINNKIRMNNEKLENNISYNEKSKTMTIENPMYKANKSSVIKHKFARKMIKINLNKKLGLKKLVQQNKNNDINQNEISQNFEWNEKSNIYKTGIKEDINRDNILKTEVKENNDKFGHIEINIIKNQVTKKFFIKNIPKDEKENKLTTFDNKRNKQKIKSSDDLNEIINNREINKINIESSRNKNQINNKSKIKNDIKTRENIKDERKNQPVDKIKKIKESVKKIEKIKQDYEVEKEKNIESLKIKINENDKNEQNNKSEKITNKNILPKNKEKTIYFHTKNIEISSSVIAKRIPFKTEIHENKSNLVKNIEGNENNIKEKADQKGHLEEVTENKKVEKNQINNNFIKDIQKRIQIFPVIELRKSKSEIFSTNIKKSSLFIFNKLISLIENKNGIISSYVMHPLNKQNNSQIQFHPTDFKYLGVIGTGEYGKIYLVQWINNDNQFYALKYEKFKEFEEAQKSQNITRIIKEFIEKTKSKGIIKIYGDICLKNQNLYHYYTLMEKSERDVEQECIIRNNIKKYYTEKNLIDILCQLILTCSSLQKNCICHGDIKPQNILILNGFYKLSDFGEVKIINPEGLIEQDIGGTELYMSPKLFFALKKKEESVIHNAYKSDVFSLALCMLLMATFDYQILVKIRELTDMEKLREIVRGFLSKRYSNHLIDFLLWMLEIDENRRPDFIELESKLVKK